MDLVKDFEGPTVTSYARRVSRFLWSRDELNYSFRIVDEGAPDRSGLTDREFFSPNQDLD
jgi:hypothetical protein